MDPPYEYLRNDALQAVRISPPRIPPSAHNLFGASLGGPIRRTSRSFSLNYEGRRQTVATERMWGIGAQSGIALDVFRNRL